VASTEVASGVGFRPAEVLRMVEGVHSTTVRWAVWPQLGNGTEQQTLSVEITPDATAVQEHTGCSEYLEIPARLSLASNDGLLNVEVDATIIAHQADRALVEASVPTAQLREWSERLAPLLRTSDDDRYLFNLELTPELVAGSFKVQGLSGFATCKIASWPAERACESGTRELPFGETVSGIDPATVLAQLNELGNVELSWRSQSVSLAAEFELAALPSCVTEGLRDLSGAPTDKRLLEIPLRAHLVTSDGQLDAWIKAVAAVEVTSSGTIAANPSVYSYGLAAPESAVVGIEAPQRALIGVQNLGGSHGQIKLRSFSPKATPLLDADVEAACLNDEFLGEIREVAQGHW